MRTRSTQPNALASRTRPGRGRVSYRQTSSENSDAESVDELYIDSPKPKRPSSVLKSSRLPLRPSPLKKKAKASTKLKKGNCGVSAHIAEECEESYVGAAGKIPHWHTLPYEILLQIFHYASHPLCDDQFEPIPLAKSLVGSSVGWLLKAALVCKSFAEPALSVLYYAPPLSPPYRAHGLLEHFLSQNHASTFDYRNKVKYLDIEATSILMLKYGGRDPIRLEDLIACTPQLRGIGIHFISDQPKHRKKSTGPSKRKELVYSNEVFDALERNKISLISWKWNLSLSGIRRHLLHGQSLKRIHSRSPFQHLRNLTLVRCGDTLPIEEEELADAVNALPKLKHLSMELSPWTGESFFPMLPQQLESFQLIDCQHVTSETLHIFLVTNGSNLRQLVLSHNQSLNLAFVVDLAVACPKLEVLKMNLRYYNSHDNYSDSEPSFDSLLLPDEIPTWPASLQILELHHLRKWESNTVEMFFQSLIDAACTLLNLRKLDIKASVNIDWRDRANFRNKWINQLTKVFLRKSPDPDISFKSFEAFHVSKKLAEVNGTGKCEPKILPMAHIEPPSLRSMDRRRFSHVEIPKHTASTDTDSDTCPIPKRRSKRLKEVEHSSYVSREGSDDSDISIFPNRRNRRLKEQDDDAYGSPSQPQRKQRRRKRKRANSGSSSIDSALEDLNEMESSSQGKNEEEDENLFIQGLCDEVAIQIDNLRPAEEQFHENDFLDPEPSGDEEWNGDDAAPGEGRYAW
ncbi:MAG: hypothetical protein Q9187_004932 [Circinaria calcarea]